MGKANYIDRAQSLGKARVLFWERILAHFEVVTAALSEAHRGIPAEEAEISKAKLTLRGLVYGEIVHAERDMAMWAGLVQGSESRRHCLRMIAERFREAGCLTEVMSLLDPRGIHPHRWESSDEEGFRQEIKSALKMEKAARRGRK